MKVPLGWLSELVALDADAQEIARRMTAAGVEVEAVERLQSGFTGVVVARVLKAERHPNADRLKLCEVDAGGAGRFTVVCGAPNARAGMTAALAKVGARLGGLAEPGDARSNAERMATAKPLEAAVIRGVRSEGMLCSERELGFSNEHEGILQLDSDAPVGADLAAYLKLDETVLDLAITANRGDCLSVLGVAREAAAIFGKKLRIPKIKPLTVPDSAPPIAIEIAAPDLCPRYAALKMSGVVAGRSPLWLRRRLELCGMRALGAVVDVTNYVMLELGQPLHAFDFGRLGTKIIVRRAGSDREFVTLDGVTRRLDPSDLLIADDRGPLAIAGVMGGRNSEVVSDTREILLESAYFEPMTIARTARRLGLRSEASYRFERGIDRAGQVRALHRAAALIRNITRSRAASLVDVEPSPAPPREIILDLGAMASLLGTSFPASVVKRRLAALGAAVNGKARGILSVTPPPFRPDLNEPADLAEEVARLTGLDDIPALLPERVAAVATRDRNGEFINRTREVMLGSGLTELKTLAFVSAEDNRRYPGHRGQQPVRVTNPISAEHSELRLSLIPGMLGALAFNLNREARSLNAFEIARVYARGAEEGVPIERLHLAALGYGDWGLGGIGQVPVRAGFFTMKGIAESWFRALGASPEICFVPIDAASTPFLHPGRGAALRLHERMVGYLGELHPREAMRLELGDGCVLFELDLDDFISYGLSPPSPIKAPPKFPAVRRDLALVVDRDLPAARVIREIRGPNSPLLEDVELFDVYVGSSIAPGKKSVALTCRYRAKDRTLTDEEVNRAHAAVIERVRVVLGAELRQ